MQLLYIPKKYVTTEYFRMFNYCNSSIEVELNPHDFKNSFYLAIGEQKELSSKSTSNVHFYLPRVLAKYLCSFNFLAITWILLTLVRV